MAWRRRSTRRLLVDLLYLTERLTIHMATLEDAVADLTTAVNTLAGNDATLIADLKAALANGDIAGAQALADQIEANVANLNTVNQAVVEAITPAAPPA